MPSNPVKERPILMSGPMTKATIEDLKTNTRRTRGLDTINFDKTANKTSAHMWKYTGVGSDGLNHVFEYADGISNEVIKCPYGKVGDRLWVRERQKVIDIDSELILPGKWAYRKIRVQYLADGAKSTWIDYPERLKGVPVIGKCLSYGGFRESSRINLEITGIRVERLQDITYKDMISEGWPDNHKYSRFTIEGRVNQWFQELWESINGSGSWDVNPWVWVVVFRRITS